MRFNRSTDYAVRCVLYLSGAQRACTSNEISRETGVPKLYAQQLLRLLRLDGLVHSVAGISGGYRLAKSAEEITVYDVVQSIEKEVTIIHRKEEDEMHGEQGTRLIDTVHGCFHTLQSDIDRYLMGVTIHQLRDQICSPA